MGAWKRALNTVEKSAEGIVSAAPAEAWERIAVVTDVHWVANATRMFAFLLPGLVKVFSNEEQSDAEEWIAA
nr:STAS/SEC14 domain-containing protein [Acidithiobacillus ferrooxidans]